MASHCCRRLNSLAASGSWSILPILSWRHCLHWERFQESLWEMWSKPFTAQIKLKTRYAVKCRHALFPLDSFQCFRHLLCLQDSFTAFTEHAAQSNVTSLGAEKGLASLGSFKQYAGSWNLLLSGLSPITFFSSKCPKYLHLAMHGSECPFVLQVSLIGPFLKTAFSTTAGIDVSSPKRLQVSFQEGRIGTPRLMQGIEFPDSTYVLGQFIDLRNLKVRKLSCSTLWRKYSKEWIIRIYRILRDVVFF